MFHCWNRYGLPHANNTLFLMCCHLLVLLLKERQHRYVGRAKQQ